MMRHVRAVDAPSAIRQNSQRRRHPLVESFSVCGNDGVVDRVPRTRSWVKRPLPGSSNATIPPCSGPSSRDRRSFSSTFVVSGRTSSRTPCPHHRGDGQEPTTLGGEQLGSLFVTIVVPTTAPSWRACGSFPEQPDQLDHEKWIATRALSDHRHDVGRELVADDGPDQLTDVGIAERPEREPMCVAHDRAAPEIRGRSPRGALFVARGAEHDCTDRAQYRRGMHEYLESRRSRLVEVVEDDQQRLGRGGDPEDLDDVVEQLTAVPAANAGRSSLPHRVLPDRRRRARPTRTAHRATRRLTCVLSAASARTSWDQGWSATSLGVPHEHHTTRIPRPRAHASSVNMAPSMPAGPVTERQPATRGAYRPPPTRLGKRALSSRRGALARHGSSAQPTVHHLGIRSLPLAAPPRLRTSALRNSRCGNGYCSNGGCLLCWRSDTSRESEGLEECSTWPTVSLCGGSTASGCPGRCSVVSMPPGSSCPERAPRPDGPWGALLARTRLGVRGRVRL